MNRALVLALACAFLVCSIGSGQASSGTNTAAAGWAPGLFPIPGIDDTGYALTTFDDGTGSALYAGGAFNAAGLAVTGAVARWDGHDWSAVGRLDGRVFALAAFDDGCGWALYAGGNVLSAGNGLWHLMRWDGAAWTAVGGDLDGVVRALTVFNGKTGPVLVAGGSFTHAGDTPANGIACWDGRHWSPIGGGVDGAVTALLAGDLGGSRRLYVGGRFTHAGALAANNIAAWDGQSWAALGDGVSTIYYDPDVDALAIFDDGCGASLYAGGWFSHAGGVEVNGIAKWDGTQWCALGDGAGDVVSALTVLDDGSGPALFVGGSFYAIEGRRMQGVARWDGSQWSDVGGSLPGAEWVRALCVTAMNGQVKLCVAGEFDRAGATTGVKNIAAWDGQGWSALGTGINRRVTAIEPADATGATGLYVGGNFDSAGDIAACSLARWDDGQWSTVGGGITHQRGWQWVDKLVHYDDGSGTALYVGGYFDHAGEVETRGLARWDGSAWSAVGGGLGSDWMPEEVEAAACCAFDDGTGPALYVGGFFERAGSVPTVGIARWDGRQWSAVGEGFRYEDGWPGFVAALAVYDDGRGPALYAAGEFDYADGMPAASIARWDGQHWAALGEGVWGQALALCPYDDGPGSALWTGGTIYGAGGQQVNGWAFWRGNAWTTPRGPLASSRETLRFVFALMPFDDGTGPALLVGGAWWGCNSAGGLARWDGHSLAALPGAPRGTVWGMRAVTEAHRQSLYAGGDFSIVGDGIVSHGMARWSPAPPPAAPGIGVK
jgi:trimeric autotransporter adhesin